MEIYWGNKKPGNGEMDVNTGFGTFSQGIVSLPEPTIVLTDADVTTELGHIVQDMRHAFITEAAKFEKNLRSTSSRCIEQLESISNRHQKHMDTLVGKHRKEVRDEVLSE